MFIYSLPLLFTQMQVGTPIELIIIITVILAILYIATPLILDDKDLNISSNKTFYNYLLNAWVGQSKLWKVFWPFFIILNLSLYIADNLAKSGNFTVSSWDEVHFMLAIPVIFWTISVWRNSINTQFRFWAALARLMTLAVFFEYGLKMVIRIDYPRIFFSCQDIILDYGSCF